MFAITCITVNNEGCSAFTTIDYQQSERNGMSLSDQLGAKNFRLRQSEPGYQSDWHLAGDPTLIIVQKGALRITLKNNDFMEFYAGDMFIAADNLPSYISFDQHIHGHKAEVIGYESLLAVHIKLDNFR